MNRCGWPSGSSYSRRSSRACGRRPGSPRACSRRRRPCRPSPDPRVDGHAGLLGDRVGVGRRRPRPSAPVAGDHLGQRAVVVPVLVGGHHGGRARRRRSAAAGVAGSSAASISTWSPVCVAAQQVAVVGHLRVHRDLGDRQGGQLAGVGRRRPATPLRCSHGHHASILGQFAVVAGQSVAGRRGRSATRPRSAAGAGRRSGRPRRTTRCGRARSARARNGVGRGAALGHRVQQQPGELDGQSRRV